jgi:hypothetical protein
MVFKQHDKKQALPQQVLDLPFIETLSDEEMSAVCGGGVSVVLRPPEPRWPEPVWPIPYPIINLQLLG